MKTKLFMSIAANVIFFCFFITQVHADMLSGGVIDKSTIGKFQDSTTQKSVYVSPMEVTNLTNGGSFMAFCGDFRVNTSSAFGSTGQAYGSHSLSSSSLTIYSDFQKSAIDTLFGNTYSSAFGANGVMMNVSIAKALQLCVWEILTEGSGVLDLMSGDFQSLSGIDAETTGYAKSFLAALNGDISWDSLGYDYTHYDIDVWVAEGGTSASQTLINVKPAATPEPATLLILGIGMAAMAPLLKRKQHKELVKIFSE